MSGFDATVFEALLPWKAPVIIHFYVSVLGVPRILERQVALLKCLNPSMRVVMRALRTTSPEMRAVHPSMKADLGEGKTLL